MNMNYMYSADGKNAFNVVYFAIFSWQTYTYNDTCYFWWKSYKQMQVSA